MAPIGSQPHLVAVDDAPFAAIFTAPAALTMPQRPFR
jgi:hypothetical protein